MGRHWLDISRYGDSVTLRGFVYPQAWRYRDYVIDSIHGDVPLNRVIREQIAGDLLPFENDATRSKNLIATTYLALGNSNLEEQDKYQLRMDVVDEMLDVIGKGLLGQTITCARCHDHKFDPIPSADYYALAGIFRSVKAMEHDNVSKWIEVPLPMKPELAKELAQHDVQVADLERQIKVLKGKATAKGIVPFPACRALLSMMKWPRKWGYGNTPLTRGFLSDRAMCMIKMPTRGRKPFPSPRNFPKAVITKFGWPIPRAPIEVPPFPSPCFPGWRKGAHN